MDEQPHSASRLTDASASASHALTDQAISKEVRAGALTGRKLGDYQLHELLGAGGMAEVYRAYDPILGREVAVKVLSQGQSNDIRYVARFRSEGRRIAALNHPHLVSVYQAGEDEVDGKRQLYLVMPLLQGSLDDLLQRKGKLPSDEVVRLFVQMSDGLEAAHHAGLIHRDVKPANVLLDAEGHPVLADFGIARDMHHPTNSASGYAPPRQEFGTPEYMAPEQLGGAPIDPRADIYSLGVMLYECLTGRLPYDSETAYALAAGKHVAPLARPSAIVPGISPALDRVTMKALARDPSDRYSTAAAFARALAEADPPVKEQSSPLARTLPIASAAPVASAGGAAAGVAPPGWEQYTEHQAQHLTLPQKSSESQWTGERQTFPPRASHLRIVLLGTVVVLTCMGGILALLQYEVGQQGRAGQTGNSVDIVASETAHASATPLPGTPLATTVGGGQAIATGTPGTAPSATPGANITPTPTSATAALSFTPTSLTLGPSYSSICSAMQTITNTSGKTVGWSWQKPTVSGLHFRINNGPWTSWPSATTYTSPGARDTLYVVGDCQHQSGTYTIVVKDTMGSRYTFTMTLGDA